MIEDKKKFVEELFKAVEDFKRRQAEYEHQLIIKACSENDFVVPSVEIKEQLEKFLPEGTRIIVSHFTTDILMVKKYVLDFPYVVDPQTNLSETQVRNILKEKFEADE